MRTRLFLSVLLASSFPLTARGVPPEGASVEQQADTDVVVFGFDVLPLVGTSSGRPDARRRVSLNLIGGLSGGIEAFEAATIFNITNGGVHGAQLAGVANLVSGRIEGFHSAGIYSHAGGPVEGAQFSGIANTTIGSLTGLQSASILNLTTEGVYGAQLGGIANIVAGPVRGLQVTGILNVAAGPVDGVQVGLVNVAERTDFALGLVNVYYDGRTHLAAWGSETGLLYTGVQHGGDYFHYQYFVAADTTGGDGNLWGVGMGLSGHVPVTERGFVDVDLMSTHLGGADDADELNALSTLRVAFVWSFFDRFAVFGGPTYNVGVSRLDDGTADLGSVGVTRFDDDGETHVSGWPGFQLGLRLL